MMSNETFNMYFMIHFVLSCMVYYYFEHESKFWICTTFQIKSKEYGKFVVIINLVA